MAVNDLPPVLRLNPSNDILIDYILKPMVERKETRYGKFVQTVEDFYSFCPSELDGAKDILENKENSFHLFVRRNRRSANGTKVRRAAKGGRWKARGKYEKITTRKGIKAKKWIFEYTPKPKSEECGVKWIMEEYVLDRGKNFEDYALCVLRLPRGSKREQGEEPTTRGKRKDADNAAEEKDNSRHGEGPKTNPPLPTQTNPPLPIENCSQETSDTGSLLLSPYEAELERRTRPVFMQNDFYYDQWLY